MLRELVESVSRFPNLPPDGYESGPVDWVLEIDNVSGGASLTPFGDRQPYLPTRGDRSNNPKPALLVDNAKYALGLGKDGKLRSDSPQHASFVALVRDLAMQSGNYEISRIAEFLQRFHHDSRPHMTELRQQIVRNVKPASMVAFRASAAAYAFESPAAQAFWRRTLIDAYCANTAQCCLCGARGPVLRILPFQVSFAGYSCPISSFNKNAFNSYERDQTANSPLCFGCASHATRVLAHLLTSPRHHRVLVRDESTGEGKSPLRNQWAVFWLKHEPPVITDSQPLNVEQLLAMPLGPVSEGPPADPDQVARLWALPFASSGTALNLTQNRFYLAVLSPNKSRLVVREWIDESVAAVVDRLKVYHQSRAIQTPDGLGLCHPSIPAMLKALQPPKAKSASADANLVRALLRTAYRGASPPEKLLQSAVLRFRIPDRPKNSIEERESANRRQALAAAIKLVLTYRTQEATRLQSLHSVYKNAPYLCGRLLAILEEAQRRASRGRVQATLVDRYYSGASTAPAATLTVLVNRSTNAHLPKVRKTGAGYHEIEQELEGVMSRLDELGGFPATLTLREQGEFALGFYHQRANFSAARPWRQPGTPQPENKEKTNDSL